MKIQKEDWVNTGQSSCVFSTKKYLRRFVDYQGNLRNDHFLKPSEEYLELRGIEELGA